MEGTSYGGIYSKVTMRDEQGEPVSGWMQNQSEHHVIEAGLKYLRRFKPVRPRRVIGGVIIAAELTFQNAIYAASLLFGAQWRAKSRHVLCPYPYFYRHLFLRWRPCWPGAKSRFSKEHLGVKQRSPFRNNFSPSRRQSLQTGLNNLAI